MKTIYTIFFCLLFSFAGHAQTTGGFAWGVKGGLAAGFQQWNSFQRDPLFRYHGDLYIETNDGADANALFAQVGYHIRGSALRNRRALFNGQLTNLATRAFEFRNASLAVGFKQRFDYKNNKAYYYVGLRGDYTLSTNLKEYDNTLNRNFYPFEGFTRPINYGLTGGAGIEFMFSKLIGGIIELNLAPDISYQYRQPAIGSVTDPFTGQSTTIAERRIRNFTAELTVGFRFLRVVEYID